MDELPCEDLLQSPHRLSHCGNVILFYCKRTTSVGGRSESMPMCCRLSFNREHNGFRYATDGEAAIAGKTSSHVSIVKCQRALHVQRRATTPCVLVMEKGERGGSFRYSLLTLGSSDQPEPCMEFELPYQIGDSVSILRGPTVLWRHAGDVFYTSPQAGEVRRTPVQFSHSVFGELPLDRGEVFVLGPRDPSEPGPGSRSAIQALGYLVHNGRVFDGSILLPHPYLCVTRCVLVLSAQQAVGAAAGSLRSAVAAATSHRQLVYFENGVPEGVCQLPFEQPEDIQVVNAGRHGCLFVVSFRRGHACAVRKETFEVACSWSDVGSVHVDDFLRCGTDQMLLLFKDQGSTGRPLDRFLLTDLCGISYARCQDSDAPKGSPPPPENYLLTLQALESRLQSGSSVLQELQREAGVKDRVLRQAVRALADVVSGGETALPRPEQEGVVALWDDVDEPKRDDDAAANAAEARSTPAASPQPRVEKLWRRFAQDQVVVGVILSTESSAAAAAVSLSILTEAGQGFTPAVTQTRCRVSWLPAPGSSSPPGSPSASAFPGPAAKRSRRPDARRLAVTAATGLAPLLAAGRVECRVVLHYVPRRVASAGGPAAAVVLHCGQFALNIHGDFKTRLLRDPELKTDEATEDLLSLMAVLDRWVFHVASPDHSLGDVRGWIQRRLGCKRVAASPQHLLSDESSGAAAVMLLRWHPVTPFQAELTVHSSELQTLRFLDLLSARLPASCTVRPVSGGGGGEGAAHALSLALEREVVALRACASSLLGEGEEGEEERRSGGGGHQETPESEKELQQWRELWQSDADRTRRRLSPLVEAGRYRRLTQSLSQVQLEVDLAALLDTQRTLLS